MPKTLSISCHFATLHRLSGQKKVTAVLYQGQQHIASKYFQGGSVAHFK